MSSLPPFDSDALDRRIRALRNADKPPPSETKRYSTERGTYGRGFATEDDLRRRAEADRAMRRRTKKRSN